MYILELIFELHKDKTTEIKNITYRSKPIIGNHGKFN